MSPPLPSPPSKLNEAVLLPRQRLFPSAFAVVVHLLFVLFLLATLCRPFSHAQEVPEFMLSRKDIVDKNVKESETVLSPNDFANIPEKEVDLRRLGIRVNSDPTMGNKVEGDIVGWSPTKEKPKGQQMMPKRHKGAAGVATDAASVAGTVLFDENGLARNALRQPYRRWPRNEIPYAVSAQYGSYSRSVIAKAISEYHSKTCVRFVPRDARKHTDYVWIHPDDGCYSLVGRTGGRQPLSLDSGCIQVGTVVHELMHAVGFFHEQSRYDRDSFIQILWSNVLRGADDQFEKYSFNTIDQLGEPYDYGSIMHYGAYAFSSNGKRTIVPRRNGANRMGQRVTFSEIDLRKINKLYQCDKRTPNTNRANANSRNWGQQQQQWPPLITTLNQSRRFPWTAAGGANGGWRRGRRKTDRSEAATKEGRRRQRQRFRNANFKAIVDDGAKPSDSADDEDGTCEDRNWRCIFWSMPMLHHCARSEVIRTEICPLSCGTCTPPATSTTTAPSSADQMPPMTVDEGGGGGEAGRFVVDQHQRTAECADRSRALCHDRHLNREELCGGLVGKLLCQKRCGRC
ncbi:hypothetical protein niasHS_010366 [Heterodera schachtii]|uniref:Metalloendopeptidase n=1 Tax=Heterodera schachtii TaxID=97005 RepID=A0ABD2IZJ4_HETSC